MFGLAIIDGIAVILSLWNIINNLFDISFLHKYIFLYHQIHDNVKKNFKKSRIISKEGYFCSSVIEVLPCSGCFVTCMGAHFPTFELDNGIRFITLRDQNSCRTLDIDQQKMLYIRHSCTKAGYFVLLSIFEYHMWKIL